MPPTAEESRTLQDNLNNVEDLEGEESDEYDVDVGINCFVFSFLPYVTSQDEEGDEEYDDESDEGGESEQNGVSAPHFCNNVMFTISAPSKALA